MIRDPLSFSTIAAMVCLAPSSRIPNRLGETDSQNRSSIVDNGKRYDPSRKTLKHKIFL